MDNFYKQNGSYFTTSGKKIKDLTELQTFAKAGGKEVSAPTIPQGSSAIPNPSAISNYNVTANVGGTLYGTPKSPMNTATFNAGQTPTPELPNSNPALGIYADRSAQDATQQQTSLQKELDALKAQRITDTQTALKAQQDNLKFIQGQKDADMAGYDAQFDPLKDKAVGIYDSMLDSIKDTNYKELTQQKLDLTNDIVKYSQMMRDDLDAEASQPGLLSISTGRQNAIKENYTSKISIAQAAQSAIDGNFNLAFDIMDRGAIAIERLTTDRINFINSVQTLYSTKENTAISEVLRLTTEEKEGLDNAVKDAETKLANIQKNKETIMDLMKTSPIVANKAGLLLTDTPEQMTKKLNDFYVANPQYTPDNQAVIKQAIEQYPDAGISLGDSIATVQKKIQSSRIYQNEIGVATGGTPGTAGGSLLDTGTWGGQCGDYVHKIVDNVPALGNSYEEKMARANVSTKDWKVGDVLIQKTRMPYGHVSVVTAVDGDSVTVTESNWNLDEKVGTRVIKKGDPSITGVYRGGNIKAIAPTTAQVNNVALNWAERIRDNKAKLSDITSEVEKNNPGLKSEVVALMGTLPPSKAQIDEAKNFVAKLKELRNHKGLATSVGPQSLSRGAFYILGSAGKRDEFTGKADSLISKKALNELIEAKSQGATFGALSDRELSVLSNAATTLGAWSEIDKNGKVKYFDTTEKSFKDELDKMIRDYEALLAEANTTQSLGSYLETNPAKVNEYNIVLRNNPGLSEEEILQIIR